MSTLTVSSPVEAQLAGITRQLDTISAELARQRAERQMVADLVADANPIVRQVMDQLTVALADVDVAAYASFARGAAGVGAKVVAAFDEDDLHALGENIVLILDTIREMTQPEVMGLLRRTAGMVREHPDEPAQPPSTLALIRELRDPEVRRGLARMLDLLRSVGDDATTAPHDERNQEVAR